MQRTSGYTLFSSGWDLRVENLASTQVFSHGAQLFAIPYGEKCGLTARVSSIEKAIRSGGLARTKAPRIKRALAGIQQSRGWLSLDFLDDLPLKEAKSYLESIEGVGPKTAACVLMFCYNRPALPVDTHVHRVAKRLGLIPERCSAGPAHDALQDMCPPKLVYPFHVLMVEHGRKTCSTRNPRCEECALTDHCPSAPQLIGGT